MTLSLDSSVHELNGVGNVGAKKLENLEIKTIRDLLYHIPFRYDDFRAQKTIDQIEPNESVTLRATVQSITKFATRRGLVMIKAVIADDTGKIPVTWFNQQYLLLTLKKGSEWYFTGKVTVYKGKKTLNSPSTESVEHDEQLHSGRLVPIYAETAGMSSRMLRRYIADTLRSLEHIDDPLSLSLRESKHLPSLDETLRSLHFPETVEGLANYRHRLAFEEVYTLLVAAKKRKEELKHIRVPKKLLLTTDQKKQFEQSLPFHLSPTQTCALLDLSLDVLQPYPARRLIQGEVGSGKTIVAAFALFAAAQNNVQSVFVAPTQILAHQHYQNLSPIFDKLNIPLQLVAGDHTYRTAAPNTIFIGTHALFEHAKTIKPAVVVIDEEHRFGVAQRETFWNAIKKPHVFTMTATPIPRTVAQTVLADQDVSYLDEIAEKKKQTMTKVVDEKNRQKAYDWIAKHLDKGAQAFVVCPFIDQSELEDLANIKSAEKTVLSIQKVFSKYRVGMLHGKTPKDQREKILTNMRTGKLDILVATPIIEVGIDIPNATIMVIEGAERFGLAQLHQLRGRVGRAGQVSYCLLFPSEGVETTRRLRILEKEANGNVLAEQDLKLRGTGELLGTRQHGFDTLKFASWFDEKLINECRSTLKRKK